MSIHQHVVDDTLQSMGNRDESVFIRVSQDEKVLFKRGSEEDDLSLSDWFRKLGKKRLKELGIGPEATRKARQPNKAG